MTQATTINSITRWSPANLLRATPVSTLSGPDRTELRLFLRRAEALLEQAGQLARLRPSAAHWAMFARTVDDELVRPVAHYVARRPALPPRLRKLLGDLGWECRSFALFDAAEFDDEDDSHEAAAQLLWEAVNFLRSAVREAA